MNNLNSLDLSKHKNTSPLAWNKDGRGYIVTVKYDKAASSPWTDGVEYVALSNKDIAYRLSGDARADGNWEIGTVESFFDFVKTDFENYSLPDN